MIYLKHFLHSVDCKSSWGHWSHCSKSCGGGSQIRSRNILRIAKYGGKKCNGSNKDKRVCNKRKCPGTSIYNNYFSSLLS